MTWPEISGPKLMRTLTAFAATLTSVAAQRPGEPAGWLVYVGTYTAPGKSRGIYAASFDPSTGKLGEPRLAAETESPSFLALHPTRPLLYAVNELGDVNGRLAGSVSAFAVDTATGGLRALGRIASGGAHPCHLVVDGPGGHVLVANYTGGSVASFPLLRDGSLGPADAFVQHAGSSVDPKRQAAPHAHMIQPDPENRHALVADLGLDQVLVYALDSGRITGAAPAIARLAPGSGPRHFAFSTDGRDLYVLNEMSLTVTAFRYRSGRLTEFQNLSALPPGVKASAADSGAEILVHPGGRFVYASLRGTDTLAIFTRDAASGSIELSGHVSTGGRAPRSFVIDPTGNYLLVANQRSDQVMVFGIHLATGRLQPTGQSIGIGSPVAMKFFR